MTNQKQFASKKKGLLIFLIIISFLQSHSQVTITHQTLSRTTLQSLDSLLKKAIDSNWVAGAVGYLWQDGRVIYNKAFGYADIAAHKPMQTDDIFRIASQTKAITSVAIMMLYDEGKIKLTDPVSKYIPSFANAKVVDTYNAQDTTYTTVPAKREITVHHLLTHTSGIDYAGIGSEKMKAIYFKAGLRPGFGSDTMQLKNMANLLATQPLVNQPGEKFTYSLSVDVLGRIVEIVAGMPLDKFFETRIFQPLGMKDTYFYLPADKQSRLVKVYTADSTGKIVETSKPFQAFSNYPLLPKGTYFAGGAGLSSTVADYAKFLQMMLQDGEYEGQQLLKRSTVQLMTSNQIDTISLGKDKFGLGFEISTAANEKETGISEGSFSWGGYFGTTYWADPKLNLIGELFLQESALPHGSITNDFKKLVYKK